VAPDHEEVESVSSARRRWGKLYAVTTSAGRRFLVLRDPSSEAFLARGAVLDRDALEALAGPLARTAGLALAYRLLAARDRTRSEITRALAKEGIETPGVVADIVDTLRRQGYLDDRRLASHLVQYAARHRPSGPRLLRRKLRAVGVADEIIEAEIREALPGEREREAAEALARRKLRGAKSREQAVRRVHALLARRGFSDRIVNGICAAILKGTFRGEHDDE
jgi:SOS response regulatory protein OraA/RecX